MAILLAVVAVWIAAGFGRTVLFRMAVLDDCAMLRFAYSGGIGLATAAYCVFLIGWCGLLSFWPVTLIWLAMASLGFRGLMANARDLALFVRSARREMSRVSLRNTPSLIALTGGVTLLSLLAAAVLICFKPPSTLEWDAISYHLADPAQFLMAHRVYSIPTEHHSNFPLLMEMLFTVGMLYNGFALANLMHLAMALLTVFAIFAYCRRLQGSTCAWIAAILFASTPVVLWESSVAYIEMGLGLFTTLAVLAAVRGVIAREMSPERVHEWLLLSAICAGFALGVKYLALVPFGLILITVALRARSLRRTITFAAVALAFGSPWYIKNAIVLHNPVYPFYYSLFPGSVNWTAGRAAGYQAEQSRFGTAHSLKKPAAAASNLLEVPWDLQTLPLVNRGAYSNEGEFSYLTFLGGLVFAFNAMLLLRRRINAEASTVLLFGALQVAAWFFVAQISRYLVSVLPLLAITGAYSVAALIEDLDRRNLDRSQIAPRITLWLAALLLAGQVAGLLWVILVGPTDANVVSLPQIADIITSPGGTEKYLRRRLDTFAVSDWLNKHSRRTDGVVIYDDTRGLYIDRPYIWANEEHSGFIPYAAFKDGQELTDWMLQHNYRYAMVDMNWSPQYQDRSHVWPGLEYGPAGNEELAFQTWYASAPLQPVGYAGYRWRGLVADAFRRGLWKDAGVAKNGVILLIIGADKTVRAVKMDVGTIGGAN